MTEKLKNVYIKDTALVAGPLETKGNFNKYFDKSYDTYCIDKSFEKSEIKLAEESVKILLNKTKIKDIDLIIGGDLLNQLLPLKTMIFPILEFFQPVLQLWKV